jgi:hypothetical protein
MESVIPEMMRSKGARPLKLCQLLAELWAKNISVFSWNPTRRTAAPKLEAWREEVIVASGYF